MNPLFQRWQEWILHHRYLSILVVVALTLVVASGARFLGFSTNYRAFFGKDNPQLVAFESLQNIYSKDDNVMLVVEPKAGGVFTPETLAVVQELTLKSWEIPYSTRVDSITNFQHTRGTDDELIVSDLVEDPSALTPQDLASIRQMTLEEPLLIHRLINPAADVTAVNVTVELPGEKLTEVPEVAAHVRQLRDRYLEQHPNLKIHLTGLVMLNNAFAESGQADMMNLTPVMFLVILGLLVVLTRSIAGTVSTLAVIVLSTLSAMGFAGFIGVQLTPTSITATTVIMTLAVADCVHIVISILQNLGRGERKFDAIRNALQANVLPVSITSVTTAIGFLSLNFSDSPPYHDYGNITAFGVMMACLLSLTLLPAAMMILPVRARAPKENNSPIFVRLGQWVTAHRRALAVVMPISVVVLIFGIQRIQLNDQFVNYFDPVTEFRRDTDAVMEKLTGIYNISFPLKTELDGGVSNPEYLKVLDAFAEYLRSEEDVVHVNALTDTYKRLNRNMNGDDDAFYKLPDDVELAAQYLLLYEMSLPFGLDLTSTVDIDKTSSKLVATLKNTTTVRLRDLEDRANAWITQNAAGVFEGEATSPSVMFSHISKRNIDSMISGTVISMGLITIIMILAMGSLRYGLLSLIPNLLPVLMAFGFWGYLEGMVDMGVATIAGLTLGIVVDDTVHLMIKYLRARRENHLEPALALHQAFERVGPALMMTSLVLVAGFIVMTFSTFRMNWTMGVMSAVTIAFALIVDLLLLPVLLMFMDYRAHKKKNLFPVVGKAA